MENTKVRVLAFAGSTRSDSFNKKLLKVAARGAFKEDAEVTFIDFREFPLPLYDEDLEKSQGIPAECSRLKKLFKEHDALLISSPEYNSSISAVLKNALDWVSRPVPGEQPLECFDGKVAALLSASPGALGGLRGLSHLRSILGNIKVLVIPDQIAVGKVHEAFLENSLLKDEKLQAAVEGVAARLTRVARALKSSKK